RNLGHQSATINLAARLMELTGFRGLSTFVYADYRRDILGDVVEKIGRLMPGVDVSAATRMAASWGVFQRLRFIDLERAQELPRCRFGFTGGADDLSVNYAVALRV